MKEKLFVLLIVLLLSAGVVWARPISLDGETAYPVEVTVTAAPYPVVLPTETAVPTITLQPTAKPESPRPTAVSLPPLDSSPYVR